MIELVTLEEAHAHLRIDDSEDIPDLLLKINAASSIILNHLGVDEDYYADSNGVQTPPAQVKAATLLMLGELNENREGEGNYQDGRLPAPVRALLGPLRDPVMA